MKQKKNQKKSKGLVAMHKLTGDHEWEAVAGRNPFERRCACGVTSTEPYVDFAGGGGYGTYVTSSGVNNNMVITGSGMMSTVQSFKNLNSGGPTHFMMSPKQLTQYNKILYPAIEYDEE